MPSVNPTSSVQLDQAQIAKLMQSIHVGEMAGSTNDPGFYGRLGVLPNPDPILRKLCRAGDVYACIEADAHVQGEMAAARAGVLTAAWRIEAPENATDDELRATEFCRARFAQAPAENITWPDLIWSMTKAIYYGFRVHEIIWDYDGKYLLPTEIVERPNRRFVFDDHHQLRLLTKEQPIKGEPVPKGKFLLSRHQPSADNPYGIAKLSACYWPYTFKHGAFRQFYKHSERVGVPFVWGTYPTGASEEHIRQMNDGLASMLEASWGAGPEGAGVQLIETKSSGQLPQHALINECDRQMSKALNSQTMATDQSQNGSRAASQTARERELSTFAAEREIVAYTMDELLRLMTVMNFGGVRGPVFEFRDEI